MIIFKNITKIYSPDFVALDNINMQIRPKEFISIVGRSGAGKTTLLRLLIAEERPTKGEVLIDNQDINEVSLQDLPLLRRRIGMIFQDFKLLPNKNVHENISFAMEAAGRDSDEIGQDIPQILEIVGLKDRSDCFPYQLSGGEKQRAAIARALAQRPDVIVADEPTGNLDPIHTWDVINLLTKINEWGTIVILATHDKDLVNSVGRRVVTLDKGKIVKDQVKKGKYII